MVCICVQRVITLLQKNMVLHVAFLDASKAFDRVNRPKLLKSWSTDVYFKSTQQ